MYQNYKINGEELIVTTDDGKQHKYKKMNFILSFLKDKNDIEMLEIKLKEMEQINTGIPQKCWERFCFNFVSILIGSFIIVIGGISYIFNIVLMKILCSLGALLFLKGFLTLTLDRRMRLISNYIDIYEGIIEQINYIKDSNEKIIFNQKEQQLPLEGVIETSLTLEESYRIKIERLKKFKEEIIGTDMEEKPKIISKIN